MVVAVFEDEVAEAVDPGEGLLPVMGENFPHVVGVARVEDEDPSAGGLEHHRVGVFDSVRRLDRDRLRPALSAVGAAGGDHMLAGRALRAGTGGDAAEPGAVVGADHVGLIAVGNRGNPQSVFNFPPVKFFDRTHI